MYTRTGIVHASRDRLVTGCPPLFGGSPFLASVFLCFSVPFFWRVSSTFVQFVKGPVPESVRLYASPGSRAKKGRRRPAVHVVYVLGYPLHQASCVRGFGRRKHNFRIVIPRRRFRGRQRSPAGGVLSTLCLPFFVIIGLW